ncbi:Ubiquitin fusion degradation protein UFD1 [Metarhizium rileyi]|uniref:Ubiquitin fusion degradation protein UFD1 n=1 Tax=Metarhizium rileyi (strain RCEF 4871) TaxID=1649241 RepID=A0A167C9H8_METRR|nr:Ubiquitin fusion degradation protein UFD1 [Metarhizium rileyi RCEF 4871]TWU76101.1 hypothetical protein ED733_007747 [Metarhizium rileyi]
MEEHKALRWSGTFKVLPATATSVKNLSGDKIILPQSALEQLLAAAPSRPITVSSFTAWDPHNPYGSNGLGFEQRQQLPHPLTFRLVNSQSGNVVFAGIREFSADEGTMGLSPFLLEALGIESQQLNVKNGNGASDTEAIDITGDDALAMSVSVHVTVHATNVLKGTYVRLRPLEAGYNPDDWKSLLERHLREHYTCLTKDSILSVNGVRGETFKFLIDKFSPEGDGICVVDTDLEVDIEALNEEQARETMRQIMTEAQTEIVGGVSKGGILDIWKDVSGKVPLGGYVDYVVPSWDRSQPLTISLIGIEQETSLDLFVTPKSSRQRAPPRDTNHVFGDFSSAEDGIKCITLTPTNLEMEVAESILVSVHGYPLNDQETSESIPFTLRARVGPPTSKTEHDCMEVDGKQHSPDDEQCRNCRQWVPKRTMILHENFCRRNNISCPHCPAVYKKDTIEWHSHWHCDYDSAKGNSAASKSKHDKIFHENHSCQGCEFTTNSLSDLARHRTSVCPSKLILCRFCHLEVPQEGDPFSPSPEVVLSGLTAHELADGARTTECHLCDKIVRLRDMETHMKHHELDKVSREKPEICHNVNCGRTLHGVGPKGQIGAGTSQGQGPGNDVGLCSICFGPLYVSMHDPEGKALKRRIERKYLGQMMTGCGKSYCANEWCKTGRKNLNMEAKGSSASAVLPLVKPLIAMVGTPDGPMYFCVDETNQKRRTTAEMLAAEKVWDVEWCVAAAEAEKGNMDRMRDWLQAWAPRK